MVKDPLIVKETPTCVPTPHILPLSTPDILPLLTPDILPLLTPDILLLLYPDLLWFKDQILAIP